MSTATSFTAVRPQEDLAWQAWADKQVHGYFEELADARAKAAALSQVRGLREAALASQDEMEKLISKRKERGEKQDGDRPGGTTQFWLRAHSWLCDSKGELASIVAERLAQSGVDPQDKKAWREARAAIEDAVRPILVEHLFAAYMLEASRHPQLMR